MTTILPRSFPCPKCGGSGNMGTLASYRCDSCGGIGKIVCHDLQDFLRFRRLCRKWGVPEGVEDDFTPIRKHFDLVEDEEEAIWEELASWGNDDEDDEDEDEDDDDDVDDVDAYVYDPALD